jgi:hypothetical protein
VISRGKGHMKAQQLRDASFSDTGGKQVSKGMDLAECEGRREDSVP